MMKIWGGGHFLSLSSGPGRPIGVYFWVKCNNCKKRELAWTQHTNTPAPAILPDTCCSDWVTEGSCDIKVLCA